MNDRFFLAAWNSFSSEEQEAFEAWAKATLEAENAKRKFINVYLLEEGRKIDVQAQDLQSDLLVEVDREDFETLKKKLFLYFFSLTLIRCQECDTITDPWKRYLCKLNCTKNIVLHNDEYRLT
jgi:hypothetical protein